VVPGISARPGATTAGIRSKFPLERCRGGNGYGRPFLLHVVVGAACFLGVAMIALWVWEFGEWLREAKHVPEETEGAELAPVCHTSHLPPRERA
jgi:hypothetical protein